MFTNNDDRISITSFGQIVMCYHFGSPRYNYQWLKIFSNSNKSLVQITHKNCFYVVFNYMSLGGELAVHHLTTCSKHYIEMIVVGKTIFHLVLSLGSCQSRRFDCAGRSTIWLHHTYICNKKIMYEWYLSSENSPL